MSKDVFDVEIAREFLSYVYEDRAAAWVGPLVGDGLSTTIDCSTSDGIDTAAKFASVVHSTGIVSAWRPVAQEPGGVVVPHLFAIADVETDLVPNPEPTLIVRGGGKTVFVWCLLMPDVSTDLVEHLSTFAAAVGAKVGLKLTAPLDVRLPIPGASGTGFTVIGDGKYYDSVGTLLDLVKPSAGLPPWETVTEPIDVFAVANKALTWDEILKPLGWLPLDDADPATGLRRWTRPGKSTVDGSSATTGLGHDGQDLLFVFTTAQRTFPTREPITKAHAFGLANGLGGATSECRKVLLAKFALNAQIER